MTFEEALASCKRGSQISWIRKRWITLADCYGDRSLNWRRGVQRISRCSDLFQTRRPVVYRLPPPSVFIGVILLEWERSAGYYMAGLAFYFNRSHDRLGVSPCLHSQSSKRQIITGDRPRQLRVSPLCAGGKTGYNISHEVSRAILPFRVSRSSRTRPGWSEHPDNGYVGSGCRSGRYIDDVPSRDIAHRAFYRYCRIDSRQRLRQLHLCGQAERDKRAGRWNDLLLRGLRVARQPAIR